MTQGKTLLFELEAKLDLYSSRKIITHFFARISAHFVFVNSFMFINLMSPGGIEPPFLGPRPSCLSVDIRAHRNTYSNWLIKLWILI